MLFLSEIQGLLSGSQKSIQRNSEGAPHSKEPLEFGDKAAES